MLQVVHYIAISSSHPRLRLGASPPTPGLQPGPPNPHLHRSLAFTHGEGPCCVSRASLTRGSESYRVLGLLVFAPDDTRTRYRCGGPLYQVRVLPLLHAVEILTGQLEVSNVLHLPYLISLSLALPNPHVTERWRRPISAGLRWQPLPLLQCRLSAELGHGPPSDLASLGHQTALLLAFPLRLC